MSNLEKTIAKAFLEMAEGLETGSFGPRPKIALTGMGSEHGEENAMAAAVAAAKRGVDVHYIGTLEAEGVTTIHVSNEDEGHKKMEEMVEKHEVDGAVTMHFPFPIGVSTVGRVVTPAKGKEMFIATSTGTASADRIEGMIKNAVYGIITAKACGVKDPTVGILNVDGARQTEMALNQLKEGGYQFRWAESARADGGAVLRGNDVLQGTPDVLVCDSLTGNVVVKMLSAYTTGGSFEAAGYGYGPGIGPGYDKLVLIVSRASGAPLVANALQFAGELVKGKVFDVAAAAIKEILDLVKKIYNDLQISNFFITADHGNDPTHTGTDRLTRVSIICKEERFPVLRDTMAALGVTGMTVSNVMGCGEQLGKTGQYRGVEMSMNFFPKVQVDIVVSKISPELVVAAAQKALCTGGEGDGKIFVYNVENVVKVRTGGQGYDALQDEEAK